MYSKVSDLVNGRVQSVEEVVVTLCAHVFKSRSTLEEVGLLFQKNLCVDKTVYMGSRRKRIEAISVGTMAIVDIVLPDHLHESLSAIAYALDLPLPTSIVILLDVCLKDYKIVCAVLDL